MEIELYRGARSFTAELAIDPDTGEIGGDYPLDLLVQRNPVGTAAFVLHTTAEVDMWKSRIKQLSARVKSMESNAERARNALAGIMKATGTSAIKSEDGMFKAVLYPCRDVSVDIFDEAQLPPDYTAEKISYTPDKKLIRKALEDGYDVPGARLLHKDRLQIS